MIVMFVCDRCLEKFNNWGMSRSYGLCEICNVIQNCYDIPSKYLELKDENKKENK